MKNINLLTDDWCCLSCKEVVDWLNSHETDARKHVSGDHYKYYGKHGTQINFNTHIFGTVLTKKEFLTLARHTPGPKCGDLVEVSNDNKNWMKLYFVAQYEGSGRPYVCVTKSDERSFEMGNSAFIVNVWKYMRPIKEEVEVAVQLTINGKEVDINTITEEQWTTLKQSKK